ncbi:MAG: pyruvate kinase [Dehalococcoidales bacterium]|nr:pyruvate kinase [Dehalococcoidales bacterium]
MKHSELSRRRTKIVCTIGPATGSAAAIERLILAGMNIARLNLSHGTHQEHDRYIKTINEVSHRLGIDVAILMDLPGPKYRTGKLKNGQLLLKNRSRVVLTTRQVIGDTGLIPVNLPNLARDVKAGDLVLLDDGAMQLKVLETDGIEVRCRVVAGGVLTEGRGVVVPGMRISGPFITDSLKDNLVFAISKQPEYIALSFVSNADDVKGVKEILQKNSADIPIIAKIERGDAVSKFDSILAASDGIMVARGDLGVDIPLERVPMVQKEIIQKCNLAGKPVIVATQMLESMINAARPTRAEVTDIANAIFDGADATMLSAETSIGKYPVQAVTIMAKVAQEAEKKLPYDRILMERGRQLEHKTDELISYSACHIAYSLKAKAIVAFTQSGSTAGRVSKYRPRMPILAITPDCNVCRRLLLHWGVHPEYIPERKSMDELFATGVRLAKEMKVARPGDLIIITGGIPIGVAGSTNLLKVEKVT